MSLKTEIFEKNYLYYCDQLATVDFNSKRMPLSLKQYGEKIFIPFFNENYEISNNCILDSTGKIPDYMICVILAKYILLCPDQPHHDTRWLSFNDLKEKSHFTNINYYRSDTVKPISKKFSGKLGSLYKACTSLGGYKPKEKMPYDLTMQFDALPRISLLLLFNDRDEEFSAYCSVMFQKHSEKYLDPESLAMISALLAKKLISNVSL